MATERETWIPAAWPTETELFPTRVMTYPAAPNTDAVETVRPPAGGVR